MGFTIDRYRDNGLKKGVTDGQDTITVTLEDGTEWVGSVSAFVRSKDPRLQALGSSQERGEEVGRQIEGMRRTTFIPDDNSLMQLSPAGGRFLPVSPKKIASSATTSEKDTAASFESMFPRSVRIIFPILGPIEALTQKIRRES